MISLLVPTRNRPEQVRRLVDSAIDTAANPEGVEFVFYEDDDAPGSVPPECDEWTVVRGPRIVLSEMWNRCAEVASGDILGHMGDDLVFRSNDWDTAVRQAFEGCQDRVLFVHGNDGHYGEAFGTHGFIHRTWMETVGYFVPPYFSSDWNDTWLNDVANQLGRRVYLPSVFTEHMHYVFGKAERDATYAEREARGGRDRVDQTYRDTLDLRLADVEKLRAVMDV